MNQPCGSEFGVRVNITSFISNAHTYLLSLHLSLNRLLWKHLLEPSIPPTSSFLLQLALLRMLHVSRVINGRSIHILHPSNRVSCSLLELRIKSSFLSALARQWSLAGAPFSVSFPNSSFCIFLALFFSCFKRKKLAMGFEPSPSELVVAY